MSVTDDIRSSCAAVAERARFLRINRDAIERYALSLPLERAAAPTLDRATHYVADDAGTLAYFVTLDAINFGSGFFPHLAKRPGMSGYFTVASSLKDEFERAGAMSAERLAGMSAGECATIFGQRTDNAPAV